MKGITTGRFNSKEPNISIGPKMNRELDKDFLATVDKICGSVKKDKQFTDRVLNELFHDDMLKQKAFRNVEELRKYIDKKKDE